MRWSPNNRRSCVSLAVGAVWLACSGCQPDRITAPEPLADQVHDLGPVFVTPEAHRTLQLRHEFRIHNATDRALELKVLGASCGCTRPTLSAAAVPAGASVPVAVQIDAPGMTDRVQEHVQLATGFPQRPELKLTLQATVHPRLRVGHLPPDHIYRVPLGSQATRTFRIEGRQPLAEDALPLELENAAPGDGFAAELTPPERRSTDQYRVTTADVRLSLSCPREVGNPQELVGRRMVRIRFGASVLEQVVAWKADTPIQINPSQVFFRGGADRRQRHTVRLESATPFLVEEVAAAPPEVDVAMPPREPALRQELLLEYVGASETPRRDVERLEVVLRTDHPDQPRVVVPVRVLDVRQGR